MSNSLFILALCLPPTVVVLSFLALLLPVRSRHARADQGARVERAGNRRQPGRGNRIERVPQPLAAASDRWRQNRGT